MIRAGLVGVAVASAFLGGSIARAPGHDEPQMRAATQNGCVAGSVSARRRDDRVSLAKARCFHAGAAIPTIVKYTYTQRDDGGAPCGTFSGTGPSFTAKLAGTYSLDIGFTIAPKDKGTKIKALTVGRYPLLGHAELRCAKLDSAPGLEAGDMCAYQFDPASLADKTDTCGSIITAPGSTYAGAYPIWSSRPLIGDLFTFHTSVVGQTVHAPRFVSPSGRCMQRTQVPVSDHFTWMGRPVSSTYWSCSDGLTLTPFVSLFYYAPGARTTTCALGRDNIVFAGQLSQFSVPADAAAWCGTLDVVWKLMISAKSGPVAHVFADTIIPLNGGGTANACAELMTHSHP